MASPHNKAVAALLITMLSWGSAAVFMRKMALSLAPENALALRLAVISAILVPALLVTASWRVQRKDWPRLIFTGIIGMFGYNWFINEGFARVAAGLGTVITMAEPIFIALLAWMVLGEKLTRSIVLGIVVAIIGAVVLFWPDLMQSTSAPVNSWGVMCLVLACLCWAIYAIGAKPLVIGYSSFTITAWTMLIAAVPVILLASEPMPQLFASLTTQQWGELLFLAIFNGLIATLMWNYGSAILPSAVSGSFLYLIPIIGVVTGALILNEPITTYLIIGGLIMLAGVAIAQFGPSLFGQKQNHEH
jgi:drug/metabolite transporter (DMT)-like permease